MGQEEYYISYSDKGKAGRDALPELTRVELFTIADLLAANPDRFPLQTEEIGDNIYIYTHPDPAIEITYVIDRQNRRIIFKHIVAPKFEPTKLIFISYSHEDEPWLLKLKPYLQELEKNKGIELWDDSKILAGDKWREKIDKALTSAKAGVLLVSQSFLTSDFVRKKELPILLDAAETKGLNILWVALSASTVKETDIDKYQAINNPDMPLDTIQNPGETNKQMLLIYERIKEVLAS